MSPIERHLLNHGGWVRAGELCRLFHYEKRQLRSRDGNPGLCSAFAISGNAGLKHVDRATEEEFDHYYARLRKHSIGQLLGIRRLRDRRRRRSAQPELALI